MVAQQPQLRAAVGRRAVVGHLQLAPARPVLRQEEIVREVGGVGHGERVGREELRRGDRARAHHVAAHHAARRHSAARGREGAVQALAVQRARGRRPADRQRGARDRPAGCEARRRRCAGGRQCARGHVAHRGEVPGVGRVVDGECAARDSGGRAQQAESSKDPNPQPLQHTATAAASAGPLFSCGQIKCRKPAGLPGPEPPDVRPVCRLRRKCRRQGPSPRTPRGFWEQAADPVACAAGCVLRADVR